MDTNTRKTTIIDYNDVANQLSKASSHKQDEDSRLSVYLLNIGIPSHILGFKYVKSALKFLKKEPSSVINFSKDLYPYIAKEFNTTPARVSREIRHSIELCSIANTELYQTLFRKKPTNTEFIATLSVFWK